MPARSVPALALAVGGAFIALAGQLTCGCGAGVYARAFVAPSMPGDVGDVTADELTVLTYNVAGLLDVLSGSHPSVNHPLISPRLNAFELALVQEDFYYHDALARDARHPYQSSPDDSWLFFRPGDGLNRFSQFAPADEVRESWARCSGVLDSANDCLTDKGFSVSWTELAQGVYVDVYNLHMDAGGADADVAARAAQVEQLLETIRSRSAGRALVVAGDTNLRRDRAGDERTLQRLLRGAALADACRDLSCGDDRIDRVLLRSSDRLQLEATRWGLAPGFVDGDGAPLSDHEPVAVHLRWRWR